MKKIPLVLFSLLISAALLSQENFEAEISAIKELPLKQQLSRFQEGLTSTKKAPLQQARYLHELGVVYLQQDDLFQAIEHTGQALKIRLEHEKESGEEVVYSAYNLGSFYQNLEDYDQAFAHFQLVLDRAPNSRLGFTLYRLGGLYRDMGEFKLSEQAYEEAGKQEPFPIDEASRATLIFEWGDLYVKQDNPEAAARAIPLLQESYEANRKLAAEDDYYATSAVLSLNRLGMAYTQSERFQKAVTTFQQALTYNEKCCRDDDLKATIFTNLGIAYRRSGQLDKALEYHQRSLEIRSASAKAGKVNMGMALGYDNIATALMHLGQYREGLQQVQVALEWALPGFSPQSLSDNPSLDLLQVSPHKNSLLTYLQDKGDLWQALALKERQEAHFSTAIETYRQCDQLIDLIRGGHLEKSTKLFWRDQARKMYQSAVKAAWIGDRPDMAFYFFEKSRAILLLDGLRELNAHSRLPETTQRELSQLATKIQYLEKIVYEQKQDDQEATVDGQLLFLRQTYKNLLDSIEQVYPAYYRQKYRLDFVDLATLQSSLGDQETWVEYFLADDFSLALVINRENIRMVEIAAPLELAPHLSNLLAGLKNYREAFDPKPALALYQYVIAPLNLTPGSRITFVADGLLSLIPFEVLIGQTPAPDQDYDQWDFLLNNFQISYAYSANSRFFEPEQKLQHNRRILAFAPMAVPDPTYGIDARLELPETRFTVERLAKLLPTDVYMGPQANRKVLHEAGPEAAVLHLATHAYLDHEQPEFSYFLVADTDPEQRRFYVNELYNRQYQADLVVLSACETGAGKLFRGEGISSIGRAFAQNGCPNLAMSLWPVDEGATGKLLENYYAQLAAGQPKAEALQTAKKAYLQQAAGKQLKHPFRWAGMIYYGADTPLELNDGGFKTKHLLWTLLGIFVLGLVLVKRRKAG